MIQFDSDAQRLVHERVAEYMTQLYGEEARAAADSPDFVLPRGSAEVNVSISSVNDAAVVAVYAWVATGVQPSLDLYRHLLEQNMNAVFGAYGLDSANAVLFRHAIPGAALDKDGLRAAIKAVADVADAADEEIVKRFGGKRAVDA
jgi:hypothetical protein